MPANRKISVSFVSEPAPSYSNDLVQGRRDPAFKALQQKLLRLQVLQVVLGLTLMVLSAVAIIEERVFFSIGFGLITAVVCIFAAVFGIQQCNPKVLLAANMIAISSLIPALYFTFVSLSLNLEQRTGTGVGTPGVASGEFTLDKQTTEEVNPGTTTTIWILSWLELLHLIPLGSFLIYELVLLKYLYNYYYNL